VLVNWASNTGGTVITNTLTGQDTNLFDATWQGGLSAVVGTGPGLAVSRGLGKLGRPLLGDIAGGTTGSVAGGSPSTGRKTSTTPRRTTSAGTTCSGTRRSAASAAA
ncbi:hypothetical protein, partial [Streptomyces rimosus]|uniref:hypothetical protein n=1 Tax=Streptomyces rimosus TaxID=1927 RepID=UPI00373FC629